MSATIIAFKPKSPTDDVVDPRRWVIHDLWNELLGMTSRQSNMAAELSLQNLERRMLTNAALHRYDLAIRILRVALEDYREELLKNMDMFCPRAAKRIREGKPPRRRKASTVKA